MAAPTLQTLLAPQSEADAKATLLQRLSGQGFPVTAWSIGGVALTLLMLLAKAIADLSSLLVSIAGGGFVGLAVGDWLTLAAAQVYLLTRNPATYTQGTIVLTCASTASGYTIVAGQLVAVSSSGLRYFNTAGGNLAAGGTLSLNFQAESAGSAYNVPGVGQIQTLGTPLPGVTINNPAIGSTGTWITTAGTDAESDASLTSRCQARWPSLSDTPTTDVFDLWAKAASTSVTKTLTQTDGTVAGQVDLYLAGAAGGVDGTTVSAVQTYVNARMPLTSTSVVASAVGEPIQLNATLYVKAGYETTAQTAAQTAYENYVNGADINGTLYQSDVIAALQNPTGVRNVAITVLARQSIGSGVGDIDLSAIAGGPHVATPITPTFTVVTV